LRAFEEVEVDRDWPGAMVDCIAIPKQELRTLLV
jgi:hypothetical protein